MKETLIDLKNRRSCRKFTAEQVREEDLLKILEAGTYAPTGMNRQAPTIVVLQKSEDIAALAALNNRAKGDAETDPFYGAPTVLVVLADPAIRTHVYDGALVMGNLMNAAHAVGVGSCYIFRAKESFEYPEGKALLRKWGLPENLVGVGNCILGYPAEGGIREVTPRKDNYIVRV